MIGDISPILTFNRSNFKYYFTLAKTVCLLYNNRMEIKRFFLDDKRTPRVGEEVEIDGDEFLHAVKVSRYKVGYKLILSNGDGSDYHATVTGIGKNSFTARIDSIEQNHSELSRPLALYLCAIEKTDVAVQKATEIGATEIRLMISRFTNAKEQNLERLRRIAVESAKQCGRALVPKIYPPISFEEGVTDATSRFDQIVFCYENATSGRVSESVEPRGSVAVIVGSEGGFHEEEVAFAREKGARVVTLGRRILRAETAAIAALALITDAMEKYEDSDNQSRM